MQDKKERKRCIMTKVDVISGFLGAGKTTLIKFDYVPGEIKLSNASPDYTGRVEYIK